VTSPFERHPGPSDKGRKPGAAPSLDPQPDGSPQRSAHSARILGGGIEPDPRFTLANERTFLAWIRTALALLAGGVAVEAFTPDTFEPPVRTALAVILLVLALVLALAAGLRWLCVERAMRQQAPLPLPVLVPLLAVGGALVAGAVLVVVLMTS